MQGYSISNDIEKMDLDVIHSFLSNSYWAKGIPKETLKKAITNSFCFGVFTNAGQQVGFARLITDRATYAYLADVFIVEEYRGRGLSKWLVQTIVSNPEVKGLRRLVLATADAQGLYSQFGFKAIPNPEVLMQIWQPEIYQQ